MEVPTRLQEMEARVRRGAVPRHVAIIMDGNGRWAEARGFPRLRGHREGSESVRAVTRAARRLGVEALTLYAFSAQNWNRPSDEVTGLMELLADFLGSEREEILGNGVRLNAIGDLGLLPEPVRELLEELREASSGNDATILTLALSYGGREELVHAARQLALEAAAGTLDPATIDEDTFGRHLWTDGLPPLDLLIRTGEEQRISNFLLWQAAYAELLFSELPWPEFRDEAFFEALLSYQSRERRFGLTSAQLREGGVDPREAK